MTTLANMRTAIAAQLGDDGALTNAQIDDAIRSSIRHHTRRPWWFTQKKNATFPTVAGQEYYTSTDFADIPNIVELYTAKVTTGGYSCPLALVTFEEIENNQSGATTGTPSMITSFQSQLRLYPIPSEVLTITLAYQYKLPELTADGDTNAWMTDGEELIRQSAKYRVALDILNSEEVAARYFPLKQEAYDELLAENRRRLTQDKLRFDMPTVQRSFDIMTG